MAPTISPHPLHRRSCPRSGINSITTQRWAPRNSWCQLDARYPTQPPSREIQSSSATAGPSLLLRHQQVCRVGRVPLPSDGRRTKKSGPFSGAAKLQVIQFNRDQKSYSTVKRNERAALADNGWWQPERYELDAVSQVSLTEVMLRSLNTLNASTDRRRPSSHCGL